MSTLTNAMTFDFACFHAKSSKVGAIKPHGAQVEEVKKTETQRCDDKMALNEAGLVEI